MRLDNLLVAKKLVATRSQAENYIKLGQVRVNGNATKKAGMQVSSSDKIELSTDERYVSRAALKLASVADTFSLNFKDKIVLDVGSSTGGFTDYALQHGAKKVFAVDVGTDQLHPSLRNDPKIELYEKTDIRSVRLRRTSKMQNAKSKKGEQLQLHAGKTILLEAPDIIVADVSFISLREILPSVRSLMTDSSQLVAMVKPQFESGSSAKHKGVIKNDRMRRDILKDFELWASSSFVIKNKADSQVAGAKGNLERFYLLHKNTRA